MHIRTPCIVGSLLIGCAVAHHFGALAFISSAWQAPVVVTDAPRVEAPVIAPVPATPAPEVAPPKPAVVLALTPAQWPREVSLTQPQIFSALLDGKMIGTIKVLAGMTVNLLAARALPPAPLVLSQPPSRAPLISAKRPYGRYNQPLARNPDYPPPRNPSCAKIVQLLERWTGEKSRPPYRKQPLDFMACTKRYEALSAPDQQVALAKELANDLRQVAWQFENGPIEGRGFALDAAHIAARAALQSLKDKELTLAIAETFIWPNYKLARLPGSRTFFMEPRQLQMVAFLYKNCGATDRAVVALKTLIALQTKNKALNQADGARIALSLVYRKEKMYAEVIAILREVTDEALVRTKEDIPALEAAAAEEQARATK